jgi:hypothetical protein
MVKYFRLDCYVWYISLCTVTEAWLTKTEVNVSPQSHAGFATLHYKYVAYNNSSPKHRDPEDLVNREQFELESAGFVGDVPEEGELKVLKARTDMWPRKFPAENSLFVDTLPVVILLSGDLFL